MPDIPIWRVAKHAPINRTAFSRTCDHYAHMDRISFEAEIREWRKWEIT